jgi:hypothetical protein
MSTSNLKLRERLLALLDEGKPSSLEAPVVVREQSLGTLKGEAATSEPAGVQPAVVEKSDTTIPGACSKCGGTLFLEVGGGGKRCQACGKQTNVAHTNGVARRELESFSGGRTNFYPKGFAMALARIAGFGRR